MLNSKKSSLLFVSMLALFSSLAHAYPRGCEVKGFGYSENYLVLNHLGGQTFYLIQNRSDKPIELERHETRDVFMSPTLQAKLSPNRWAAFASDVESLHFKCYSIEQEKTSLVPCENVLDICQYPRVKFALSNMGNYWVSTNKPQRQVIKDAIKKGILLRW